MIRIEEINDISRLTVDKTEWNTLVQGSPNCTPFQTYEWITAYIKYYLPTNDLILLFAYDSDRLVGIAPLCKYEYYRFKLFRLKKIVFLGEIFSEYCDFIIHEGYFQTIIPAFIEYVFSEYAAVCRIDLRDICPGSQTNRVLFKLSQYIPYQFKGEKYLFIDTSHDISQYYNKFSRKTLQTLKRKSEKLKELGANFIFSGGSNAENIKKLALFNRQRISKKGETSFFDSDTNLNFLTEVSDKLTESGISNFISYSVGNEPISFYLCFLYHKRLYFFISGFNSKYENLSPGAVHLKAIIDYCFENNINEFDFLRGEDEYKYKFHPQARHTIRTLLFRVTRLNFLWKILFKFYQIIKKLP
jgi:CelD/BcsL family acetyltransferase involved in cellulose biosynthesis